MTAPDKDRPLRSQLDRGSERRQTAGSAFGLAYSAVQTPCTSRQHPIDTGLSNLSSRDDHPDPEPEAVCGETPTSRMLRSTGGDRVFVGPTATLSFVRFLRDSLARQAAVSDNSHEDGPNDTMFEGEPTPRNESVTDLNDVVLLKVYAKSFLLTTSGIIQVFTDEELMAAVQSLGVDGGHGSSANNLAAVYIAIATGARAQSRSELDDRYASAYFHAARNSGEDPLAMPTVRSTTVSVLMAFFMLASHRRNAAYMYLGAAARAAHALGLHHQSSYHDGTDAKILQRLWLWKSVCVLDIIVSSILGRLPAVNVPQSSDNSDIVARIHHRLDARTIAFEAAFRASRITGEITSKMTSGSRLSIGDTETYLHRLATWSSSLPEELRSMVPGLSDRERPEETKEASIIAASMNVSCSYYYAVILVTRPFLIATHKSTSSREEAQETVFPASTRAADGGTAETERLASVCVDSAAYMVETICHAKQSGSLLPNTCFIRAWIFTAALVLGFSMSLNPYVSDEASFRAFRLASDFLQDESAISPHARQYYGIVDDVRSMIDIIKTRMTEKRRERNKPYVDRVVRFPGELNIRLDPVLPDSWEAPDLGDWGASFFDETQEIFFSGWEEYTGFDAGSEQLLNGG